MNNRTDTEKVAALQTISEHINRAAAERAKYKSVVQKAKVHNLYAFVVSKKLLEYDM